jgi:hypothetical protein
MLVPLRPVTVAPSITAFTTEPNQSTSSLVPNDRQDDPAVPFSPEPSATSAAGAATEVSPDREQGEVSAGTEYPLLRLFFTDVARAPPCVMPQLISVFQQNFPESASLSAPERSILVALLQRQGSRESLVEAIRVLTPCRRSQQTAPESVEGILAAVDLLRRLQKGEASVGEAEGNALRDDVAFNELLGELLQRVSTPAAALVHYYLLQSSGEPVECGIGDVVHGFPCSDGALPWDAGGEGLIREAAAGIVSFLRTAQDAADSSTVVRCAAFGTCRPQSLGHVASGDDSPVALCWVTITHEISVSVYLVFAIALSGQRWKRQQH